MDICSTIYFSRMGSQHPSPNAKTFCKFEPQIWLEIITSRDAKSACFKGSKTSCREIIFGIFWPIFGGKDHITLWMLPADRMGHTPSTAETFRKKFRKEFPETLSERFLEFPLRVRLGSPKPYNSRHSKAPEHFQNCLPPSTAGDASFFQKWFRRRPLRAVVMEYDPSIFPGGHALTHRMLTKWQLKESSICSEPPTLGRAHSRGVLSSEGTLEASSGSTPPFSEPLLRKTFSEPFLLGRRGKTPPQGGTLADRRAL